MQNAYCVPCLTYFSTPNNRVRLGGGRTYDGRILQTEWLELPPGTGIVVGASSYGREFLTEQGEFPTVDMWVEFMDKYGHDFFYLDPVGQPFWPGAVAVRNGTTVCLDHVRSPQ